MAGGVFGPFFYFFLHDRATIVGTIAGGDQDICPLHRSPVSIPIGYGATLVLCDPGDSRAFIFFVIDAIAVRPADPGRPVADLFEPFRRGGVDRTAQSGTGLGLSIVRAVVSAHGGQLYAEPVAGGGLTVTARYPPRHDRIHKGQLSRMQGRPKIQSTPFRDRCGCSALCCG